MAFSGGKRRDHASRATENAMITEANVMITQKAPARG